VSALMRTTRSTNEPVAGTPYGSAIGAAWLLADAANKVNEVAAIANALVNEKTDFFCMINSKIKITIKNNLNYLCLSKKIAALFSSDKKYFEWIKRK